MPPLLPPSGSRAVVIGRVDTCRRDAAAGANADDDAPLLKTFADGEGETGPEILELFDSCC